MGGCGGDCRGQSPDSDGCGAASRLPRASSGTTTAARRGVVAGLLTALVLFAPRAALRAQDAPAPAEPAPSSSAQPPRRSPWLPRLRLDNDAYNFWIHPGHRTDEEYTDGVAASLETLRAPWWGRRLGGGAPDCDRAAPSARACLSTVVTVGHDMYTPDLTRPPLTYPAWREDRPYAALLYVAGEGRRLTTRTMRAYTVQAGVMGPPALGKEAQGLFHAINTRFTTKAEGWETQVAAEPAILLGARQSWLAARWAPGGRGMLDLVPTATLSLGNIRTSADAGARLRLGMNLSHPWDPRAWRGRPAWEFHLSAEARRAYVVHDFSLDGTLLRAPNRSVERVPTVGEYAFGTGVRVHRFTLGYRVMTRSREYTTGPSRHVFGQMYSAFEFSP